MNSIFTPVMVAGSATIANLVNRGKFLLRFMLVVLTIYSTRAHAQIPVTKGTQSIPWFTTGNSGTNPSVNFLGTKDAKPLVFRVNSQKAGFIDNDVSSANTSFGYQTLNSNIVSSTSGITGSFNSGFGYFALLSNVTGEVNTAHGAGALLSNTEGNVNTAIGGFALQSNTTGAFNSATGAFTLVGNTIGSFNTGYGAYALYGTTEGSENTAMGSGAMVSNTTGNTNAAYGALSLASNETGSNNTAFGSHADVTAGDLNNATAIGAGAVVDASNKVRIGNDDVTSIGGKVGWTNYSDERIKDGIKENVPGLSFINALRPVTYHLNLAKENALLGKKVGTDRFATIPNKRLELKDARDIGTKEFQKLTAKELAINAAPINTESEKIQYTGFLAQEVDRAAQTIGYDFSGVDKAGKIMGLRYSDFVVPLVKAVQELSKKNDELDQKNRLLEEKLNKLEALINGKPTTNTFLMEQNTPNPFQHLTSIRYNIPVEFKKAQLMVADFNGRVIKKVELNAAAGVVDVDGSLFSAGSYTYSLILDGKIVETKKLVVAK